uniref:Uncharacterized protein n=1 Tax=Rhizophora mucronata TaxID=61149 RepID=A0A2P2P5S1_RHIMU
MAEDCSSVLAGPPDLLSLVAKQSIKML